MNRRNLLLSAPALLLPKLVKAEEPHPPSALDRFALLSLFEWGHAELMRNGFGLFTIWANGNSTWTLDKFNEYYFLLHQRMLKLDFLGVVKLVKKPEEKVCEGEFLVRVSPNEEYSKTFRLHAGGYNRDRYVRFDSLYGEPHESYILPKMEWV